MGLTTLSPFMNLIAKSLSAEGAVISGQVGALPVGVQFETYKYVFAGFHVLEFAQGIHFLTIIGTACACF